MEFLNKRVPKSIGGSDANRLAQELGDLPLALEQAGALQAETGMPVNEYLRLLREQASDLLAESKPSEYPVPMTAAWKLSVSKLNDKQPAALELLHCWAFFGPEPIPRDVFRQGVKSGLPRLSGILGNPILLTRAIRELGRFALAKIDTVSRTVQVHRLIQALLRDELTPAEQDVSVTRYTCCSREPPRLTPMTRPTGRGTPSWSRTSCRPGWPGARIRMCAGSHSTWCATCISRGAVSRRRPSWTRSSNSG